MSEQEMQNPALSLLVSGGEPGLSDVFVNGDLHDTQRPIIGIQIREPDPDNLSAPPVSAEIFLDREQWAVIRSFVDSFFEAYQEYCSEDDE